MSSAFQNLSRSQVARNDDEIEKRARQRTTVSPHQVQYRQAREIHELDMSDEIRKTSDGFILISRLVAINPADQSRLPQRR